LEKAREEKTREDFMDTIVRTRRKGYWFWKICNITETSKVKGKRSEERKT
jgi:hypothetical protein